MVLRKRAFVSVARVWTLLALLMLVFGTLIRAQVPATNAAPVSQDPMMNLMLSQPKLDTSSPVRAEASFDPPIVRPGSHVVYRLTLNALQEAISWNRNLPSAKLDLRPGAVGETMQMQGTNFQPRTAFNFHTTAPGTGRYVVPSFVITVDGKAVRVPEASFLSANVEATTSPQMLFLEIAPERPFVGEAVRVRVLSPAGPGGAVQALGSIQLKGAGFIHEHGATRQTVEPIQRGGTLVSHYIYETVMTPISAGVQSVYAQAFAIGNRFSGTIVISGPAFIPGSTFQYTLLDSEPVEMEFRPLPLEGRPAGFSGAVGAFSVDPPQLSTNVARPGEPLRLTVSIRGRGNLSRVNPPAPPILPEWQVLPPKREALPPQVLEARGFASFTYTIVPLKGGLRATPELPFSFFHPDQEKYVVRNIPAVPLEVLPGNLPPDYEALLKQRVARGEKEQSLMEISPARSTAVASLVPLQLRGWFPAVQLAPAVFFLGLWQWDRRRRYLEAHPEVVIRRRARRELKRERTKMRAAAARGNASGFQQSALRALQVASAPNYPAAPDAVVSLDVLELFREQNAPGASQAVERLFEAANGERYGAQQGPNLISDREGIEEALAILEEKL
jgi:hypothetical protein